MDRFSVSLGQRLRVARRQRGWSLGEVESSTNGEFKASVVGAYERGERAISVQRFVRIAEVYGFTPAELLPLVPEGEVMIDLDALVHDDGDRLAERYLNAIKLLRKDPGGPEVRHSDLAALGSILQAADMPAPSE
ncbi:MAG TPA: helix-turn-helix transcriptional regulator [Acidimicrobiia bacterium]|jgi:transcriptional regulator with XRE-family HTH domain